MVRFGLFAAFCGTEHQSECQQLDGKHRCQQTAPFRPEYRDVVLNDYMTSVDASIEDKKSKSMLWQRSCR